MDERYGYNPLLDEWLARFGGEEPAAPARVPVTGNPEDEAQFKLNMAGAKQTPGMPIQTAGATDGAAFPSRVTYYAPGPGDRMEGGFETSRPNPLTGQRIPSTLDDVRLGRSPFVTVASDPSRYGQKVNLGDLTYKSPIDGKTYTLPSVFGMVHDTGSAFRGRPDKLDVAAGDFRGWDPRQASAYVQADAGRRMVTPMAGGFEDNGMAKRSLPFAFPDSSTSRIPPEWLAGADPGDPGGGAYFNPNNPVPADFSALAQPSPSEAPPWLAAAQQNVVGGGEDATMPARAQLVADQGPPPGARPGAPPGPPPGPPTGNLPFGIPGTFFNNPIQQALGDNFSTLLAFAGGARQGGIGQGLSQAAKASLIEGPENQKMKAVRDQQLGIYQALRAKGLPHADAMSAAMSPEILKQMAPDVFGSAWKFEKVKDAFGGEVPVFVNPRSGEIRGQDGKPYNPGENPTTSPEAIDNTVKAVLEGRMAPPTSFAASKPYWQSILRRAAEVEPDFDLTKWQARQQGVKNFTSGKDAESVRAIDQTLHHMAALVGSAKELPGTNYPILNKAANLYNTQTGSDKENNFLLNAHAVAEEMSKVYKGGNLSDAEIRAWEQSLSPNMSEAQQRGAIRKLNELLQGGIHALEEKRLGAVGPAAAERMGPLLKPGAASKLQEIEGWLSPPRVGPSPPGTPPAAPKTPTAPPPGGIVKMERGPDGQLRRVQQ